MVSRPTLALVDVSGADLDVLGTWSNELTGATSCG